MMFLQNCLQGLLQSSIILVCNLHGPIMHARRSVHIVTVQASGCYTRYFRALWDPRVWVRLGKIVLGGPSIIITFCPHVFAPVTSQFLVATLSSYPEVVCWRPQPSGTWTGKYPNLIWYIDTHLQNDSGYNYFWTDKAALQFEQQQDIGNVTTFGHKWRRSLYQEDSRIYPRTLCQGAK